MNAVQESRRNARGSLYTRKNLARREKKKRKMYYYSIAPIRGTFVRRVRGRRPSSVIGTDYEAATDSRKTAYQWRSLGESVTAAIDIPFGRVYFEHWIIRIEMPERCSKIILNTLIHFGESIPAEFGLTKKLFYDHQGSHVNYFNYHWNNIIH